MIALILQSVAMIVSAVCAAWIYRDSQKQVKNLLDRIMSRDWGEYRSLTATEGKKPRSFSMTNEKEALIEKMRQKQEA